MTGIYKTKAVQLTFRVIPLFVASCVNKLRTECIVSDKAVFIIFYRFVMGLSVRTIRSPSCSLPLNTLIITANKPPKLLLVQFRGFVYPFIKE